MPKNIPLALQNHKALPATTLTGLLKIGPLPDGSFLALCGLDRNLDYDDGSGDGVLTYLAPTGFQQSAFSSTSDLGVDNAEAQTLEPIFPNAVGVTLAMVDRGDLDSVEYIVYKVNYYDLSPGNHEIVANGPLGEQIIERGGLVRLELRSWSQLLKQHSVVSYYSITCRAIFGSQYEASSGSDAPVERFPCTYDAESEWVDFIVTDVGTETVREFSIAANSSSGIEETDDYYAPGLVEFFTGDNEGQSREIEAYGVTSSGANVSLQHTTRNPISVGDTGRIRRDCTHRWSGHNSCQTYNNRPFFRGEPFIPIGNGMVLNVPGVAGGYNDASGTGEFVP